MPADTNSVYILIHDQGNGVESRSVFNSLEEAKAQANHDKEYGFGIPLRVEDEAGEIIWQLSDTQ